MQGDVDRHVGSPPAKVGRAVRVLLVENDQGAAELIVRDFGRAGVFVEVARTLSETRTILQDPSKAFDVVILELRLPDGRGESLLPIIEGCRRQPAAIITSWFLHELDTDALEYRPVVVPKPIGTATLLRIVGIVAAGYTRRMIGRFIKRLELSKREAETISLLAQGYGAKEIALQLGCSEKTVYFHLARICRKANCRDQHELFGRLFAFTCQALGHTPPEYAAFVDARTSSGRGQ